jgi:cyclopropane fatty-acyl-phospholipid synthase-like methyltransferase
MTDQHDDSSRFFAADFWDERYTASAQLWSGLANPSLMAVAATLRPGTALDVGSGEGADAIWLAQQGWRVHAVDISSVALRKAADHARDAGVEARVEWEQADLRTWTATGRYYDLVSAQFMHFPRQIAVPLYGELAASVGPGGSLLVAGHHPDDQRHSVETEQIEDIRFTPDEVLSWIGAREWTVRRKDRTERDWTNREGHAAQAVDSILHVTNPTPSTRSS